MGQMKKSEYKDMKGMVLVVMWDGSMGLQYGSFTVANAIVILVNPLIKVIENFILFYFISFLFSVFCFFFYFCPLSQQCTLSGVLVLTHTHLLSPIFIVAQAPQYLRPSHHSTVSSLHFFFGSVLLFLSLLFFWCKYMMSSSRSGGL